MNLIHDFEEPVDRVGTDSYKWDCEGENGRFIPLSVADTDFRAPRPVLEAVRKRVDFGVFAYGHRPQSRFATSICRRYERRYGLRVDPEWICHAQGLMTGALWMLLHAYTRPGDVVVVQQPVYNTYSKVIAGSGRFVESSDLELRQGRYEINFEDLERKLANPRVRLLLVCNPHNPVGRVWTAQELGRLYEIAKAHNTLILSDEIFGDIVYGNHRHIPFFSLSGEVADTVVVMGSPSKTFNLAGFYSAYLVIKDKALRDQYEVVYEDFHVDYNQLGIEALITAYNECDDYVEQLKAHLMGNIELVRGFLREVMPEVGLVEPEGTYLLWLDCRAWRMKAPDLQAAFREAGVRVNSGADYGAAGAGFIRVNVATQAAVLKQALDRIKVAYVSGRLIKPNNSIT